MTKFFHAKFGVDTTEGPFTLEEAKELYKDLRFESGKWSATAP